MKSSVLSGKTLSGQSKILLAITLLANIVVLAQIPYLSLLAIVLLLYLLPGLALLIWAIPDGRIKALEHFTLSSGISIALSVITGIVIHYIPGALPRWLVLVSSDLLICSFLLFARLRTPFRDSDRPESETIRGAFSFPLKTLQSLA